MRAQLTTSVGRGLDIRVVSVLGGILRCGAMTRWSAADTGVVQRWAARNQRRINGSDATRKPLPDYVYAASGCA